MYFADDNSIYSCQNDLKTILEDLRYGMVFLIRWFKENSMKVSLANINPDFMKPYFKIKEMPYNLRNGYALKLPSTNSTYYGINSVLFRACLLWNQLPLYIKQSQSLHEFRSKMKTLRNIVCNCKICQT